MSLVPSTVLALDDLPLCSEETVGIECVERREEIGPWEIVEVVPPVGTQNALVMASLSFQDLPGIFARSAPAELVLSCIENTTRIEVRFGENFMSDVGAYGTLIYKLDDDTPISLEAAVSADNTALGLYSGADSIPLIRSFFGGERLLVSATSFTGRTLNAIFSIEGMETAIEPLRDLCNW
ncbi:hypothetical protein roselon_01166 [Roseibacterium elongatum DSM 19469]|uniref:Uncharacterized protein n=1 Tax=Roseicyclus elongatus DSM 19469 TaxID=1294273 RepID=W8S0A3_9RHOB|nr:type VI secretion system-associated protein TagO [Roseibacterium elongatum]AHM03557.1 hypothetical protein roselon_01166 [Roseibacterium elongatum DSM 19469]